MKEIKYRGLSPKEKSNAAEQAKRRSKGEKMAFQLLPECMKEVVEQNPPIAFSDYWLAYYPDLFFREARICIEIDGEYHKYRAKEDAKKDMVFVRHGFTIIRIKNRDTEVDVAFWQRLIEGLEKGDTNRSDIIKLIDELRQMVDTKIRSWTDLDSKPQICEDETFNKQMEYMMQLSKKCRVKRIRTEKSKKVYPFFLLTIGLLQKIGK